MKRFVSLILFAVICQQMSAQSFGGLPPDMEWRQINTDVARIIFPDALELQAQRVANVVHYLEEHNKGELGDQAFKIDLIINNQSTISNASVSLAPWKSHFLTTAPQDKFALSAMSWLDLLSIHEYRHVIQLSVARRGIVKYLYYLFGEESWAGAANLSIPDWFAEGDAVWTETKLTGQGRGRISKFEQGFRSLEGAGIRYKYAKVRNGSLRDYIPDHYRLGYLMVDHATKTYGDLLWKEVLQDAASYRGIFYPFSRALKKRTGHRTSGLYHETMDAFADDIERGESKSVDAFVSTKKDKTFTDRLHPYITKSGDIIYYRRSYDAPGRFYIYRAQSGEEEPLVWRGIGQDSYFGCNGNLISWTEYSTDARWTERNYTNIVLYSLADGKKKKLTHRQRYFSPSPSSDGKKIVAVHIGKQLENELHILSLDGSTYKIPADASWQYAYPKWITDSTVIVNLVNEQGHMGIGKVDVVTGEISIVVPVMNRIVGIASVYDDWIYYSATGDKVEQIFATHITTSETFEMTDEYNGAFHAAPVLDSLYYVTFSHTGNEIKRIAQNWETKVAQPSSFKADLNIVDSLDVKQYEVSNYSQVLHALNLHTWGLFFENPILDARILSNNVLNNLELAGGIQYNYETEIWRPYVRMEWASIFPQFFVQTSILKHTAIAADQVLQWRDWNVLAGVNNTFNLSSGYYTRLLAPRLALDWTHRQGDLDFSSTSVLGQFTFRQQKLRARQNIFTHWGQYLQVQYRRAVDNFDAEQWLIRSAVATRGLHKNHNLVLHVDYLTNREPFDYQYIAGLSHRGAGIIPGRETLKMSANYHFPVMYPDWGFGGLVYIYRVRTNAFAESSKVFTSTEERNVQSLGAEVVFDVNLGNVYETSFGVRYSYVTGDISANSWELIIPVYRF